VGCDGNDAGPRGDGFTYGEAHRGVVNSGRPLRISLATQLPL
jgi:hypothetical protein